MKYRIISVAAMTVALSFSVSLHANEPAGPLGMAQQESMKNMPCPMMESMSSMQQSMESMMVDMDSMMQMMSDPALKERMQKLHENMGAMKQQMADMQKGVIPGGTKPNDEPAGAGPDVDDPHHPDNS